MSYAIRRRAAALAAASLLAGLPLLLSASPSAAAEPEASPNVDFTGGGLGLLLCGSKPATAKITIAAESRVKLTNGLGQNATLQIDGKDSAAVSDGETIEVQFHRGPVKVAMVPECLLNLNPSFEPLTVEVASRTTQPSSTGTTGSTGTTAPSRTSGSTGSSTPSSKPKSRDTHKSGSSSSSSSNPAPSGDEELPAVPDDLFDNPDEQANAEDPGPEASPAVVVGDDVNKLNPTATSLPIDNGPIGLLAIIATVCVVGVSAGAIRAIIAQRATRAEFA